LYDDCREVEGAMNCGNSGGPSFNMNGQVIGMNSAIYSPSGGSVGLGFAIPAAIVQSVVQQLRDHGRVDRGWLGVAMETRDITKRPPGARRDPGVPVTEVTPNSPAAPPPLPPPPLILPLNHPP